MCFLLSVMSLLKFSTNMHLVSVYSSKEGVTFVGILALFQGQAR